MSADDNLSAMQLQRSMKSARTKINNIELKYGAADIPQSHPLWAQRQKHKDFLNAARAKLQGEQ